MVDSNAAVSDKTMEDFCSLNNLQSLFNEPTGYKTHVNPTCFDVILTNRLGYFQHSNVFQAGISDFHALIASKLKAKFQKMLPKIQHIAITKNLAMLNSVMMLTILNIFDKHALIKQKYLRASEVSFMTKELHKRVMKRSRLRNNFLRTKSQENRLKYNKQQNFCKILLRTAKKLYFSN